MLRRVVMLAVAVSLIAGQAWAAGKTKSAPDPLQIEEHVLDNGLQVLLIEDHSAPLVSYQVFYHVGSRNEHPGITGMAHMFEHMMFRGSKKYGPEEHNNIVKAHGGSLNASTSHDRTAYFENISSDNLELVIALEAEREANLNITEETFKPEQQVIAEERRMRVDNDLFGSAQEQLFISAYNAHPYNWPVVGWMSDIQNYRLVDLKQFHKTYYAPNNATVIISGDFEPDNAMALVKKYYGNIPPQPQPPAVHTVEPPQMGERRVEFHRPAQLPFLFAAYHVPEASDPDYPVLEVAQKILSGGESSRIYRHCVYDTQVARFAGGFLMEMRDPGIFFTYIGVNAGKSMDDAEQALFSVIDTLSVNGPTEHEVQKAVNQLEADYYFGLETDFGKAAAVGEAVIAYKGDYNHLKTKLDAYRKVTPDDVKRVVSKYFRPINRTVVVVVPDNNVDPVDFSDAEVSK